VERRTPANASHRHLTWIMKLAQPWPQADEMKPHLLALAAFLTCFPGLAGCAPAPAVVNWTPEKLEDLRRTAEAAPAEGLPAETAALDELAQFAHRAETHPTASAQLDIAADALFASLAHSFAQGASDPAIADSEWRIPLAAAPDMDALRAQLAAGGLPSTLLAPLLPQSDDYRALRAELALVSAEIDESDEAAGADRAMRLVQLRANLERWRWLPRDLPASRVEVRVPQFEVVLMRPDNAPLVHAAIVGARNAPTPSFAAEIRSVTINPTWTPPHSILVNELLPRFRRDPNAAEREGFDVIAANGAVVAPSAIDWSARPFPYQLRQRPGAANALGRIRFDLPNPFAIYLHDTPNRALFARTDRALSHGCIRVAEPAGLAEAVINAPEWTRAEIEAAIATGESRTVALSAPVAIFVLYLTAAAGEDGQVAYVRDLYGRDAGVIRALDAPDAALVAGLTQPAAACAA
jgi:L,D-transpeptidase YcbB